MKVNKQNESVCNVRQDLGLHRFSNIQAAPTCQHAPMMVEQSACEYRYGNDMKLERKQSGSAQINKKNKDKEKEAKCT